MEKCFKFRIYPNTQQQETIFKIFGCCRFVFNRFLAERVEAYKTEKKSISRFEQDRNLTELKKELIWLKDADSTALQAVIQNLDVAYQNFFRRVKIGDKPGFPKFKNNVFSPNISTNLEIYISLLEKLCL